MKDLWTSTESYFIILIELKFEHFGIVLFVNMPEDVNSQRRSLLEQAGTPSVAASIGLSFIAAVSKTA